MGVLMVCTTSVHMVHSHEMGTHMVLHEMGVLMVCTTSVHMVSL